MSQPHIHNIYIYICDYQLLYAFLRVTMNMRENPKGLGFWCLTPLSTTFRLYRGGHNPKIKLNTHKA